MNHALFIRSKLVKFTVVAFALTIANAYCPGNTVVDYLNTSGITASIKELGSILSGTNKPRSLFSPNLVYPAPIWERMVVVSSIVLIVLCIPLGCICIWKRYRSNSLAFVFGMMSIFYPICQILEFTSAGPEITDRAASFLFLPIGFVLAIFIAQFWPTRRLGWRQKAFLTCTLLVLLVGGVILAAVPALTRLPGPYAVSSDSRSIEREGIQTAIWASSHFEPDGRVATDYINGLLMDTYGDQRVVTSISDSVQVYPIFVSADFGPDELSLLRQAQTRYLVVDLRVTRSLPLYGFYYDLWEDKAFKHTKPIDLRDLTKFNTIPQINKIFDGGNIVIYDAGELLNAL